VGVLIQGKTILRGLATIKVDKDEFPAILDKIDHAVEYFGKESEWWQRGLAGGNEAALKSLERWSAL